MRLVWGVKVNHNCFDNRDRAVGSAGQPLRVSQDQSEPSHKAAGPESSAPDALDGVHLVAGVGLTKEG